MLNWFLSLDLNIQLLLALLLGIILGILIMNILVIVKNKKIGAYKRQLEKESISSDKNAAKVKVLESKIQVLEKALENALKKWYHLTRFAERSTMKVQAIQSNNYSTNKNSIKSKPASLQNLTSSTTSTNSNVNFKGQLGRITGIIVGGGSAIAAAIFVAPALICAAALAGALGGEAGDAIGEKISKKIEGKE